MTTNIPYNFIPNTFRVPGTYVEVNNSQANTSEQTLVSLVIGQVTANGTLGPIVLTTSTLSSSSATLHFSSVPGTIVAGMTVVDLTVPFAAVTVVSVTSTTVVVSAPISAGSSDHIQFSPPVAPVLVSSLPQAQGLFGPDSQLYGMVQAYLANDAVGELWCLPLLDDPASTKSSCTIAISGTLTSSSNAVLSLYVCGIYVPVLLTTTMTNPQIHAAITAAINAVPGLPLTAAGTTSPVTLTSNNGGLSLNDLDCRLNYNGARNNESTPSGLTVAISGFTGGATNPSLAAGLASLGQNPFDLICTPYTDTTSLNALETFLNDSTGRWSFLQQIYGHVFAAYQATLGTLQSFGSGRNDQHATIMGLFDFPTPSFQVAAAYMGQAAVSLRADPGVPMQGLPLAGVLGPAAHNIFTISERETLLFNGISTYRVVRGTVEIDRLITTFQVNANNQPDDSYLDVCRMFLISFTARYLVSQLSSKYARCKLADDGVRIPTGSSIVTPNTVLGEVIKLYGDLVDLGVAQDFTAFAQAAVVQRSPFDRNTLQILFPADFVNQLIVTDISLQFTP